MGIKRYHDRLLGEISTGMTVKATQLHHEELVVIGRRAAAACQCREILTGLRDRIAQRAAVRSGSRMAMPKIQRPPQAA
jgi:hypothetical protein